MEGSFLDTVKCPTCGKQVIPGEGYRCPECQSFLHPDPIKRREADFAQDFRELIRRLPDEEWIGPSSYLRPSPEKLEAMSLEQLIEEVNRALAAHL